ncbi:hypothetical protein [Mycolicibacterium sphagni]|uniref:PE domain-containing protein n=1 Tax=Mycolicibacterium sphagni TaxID=1786 RepID=A0A255DBY8_9MYCO|nr:hypothetical protein [Mycolicibacterium sphagni]OYN76947.1 hypothetical protein CG716_20815 [Mycolicibacterium sphagni]
MSVIATKLQAAAGAAVIATAVAVTPAIAHAAPSLTPFAEGLGNSAELLIDPVVIVPTSSSNKTAAASVTANAAPTPAEIIKTFIAGLSTATQNAIKAGSQFVGTFAYAGLAFTGLVFTTVGEIVPGPIGDAFKNVGTGLNNAANNVAKVVKIGPYSTSA